ncbi:MAG TPA: farnesyl diphosphate synthase [Gemmatimonadaceae bacterium]|nr:farnesyl diphosphate synthase [Gemmatimonadaceae bacterium]
MPSRAADRAATDAALIALCDRALGDLPREVDQAVRYSLLGEGKRLRPLLVLAAYRAGGGTGDAALLAGAAEVVHAYSLVHDDLPCMDDDAVRRGRATTHMVYGAPVAMLAGVAMVPLAARAALEGAESLGLPRPVRRAIVLELMRASGAGGMVGGQLLDLETEGRDLTVRELERIHRAKTGALIRAAVRIGGMAASLDDRGMEALTRYGEAVGLAFQIADDVLDATATTEVLGKTAGRDAERGKRTYPSLLGVEGARARAAALAAEGTAALASAGVSAAELAELAQYAVIRTS